MYTSVVFVHTRTHTHMHNICARAHTRMHTYTANPNVHSYPGSKEVTPLHIAAGSGHLACLQLLVQLGGDIMARDTEQLTPMEYASINEHEPCFIYLLDILGMS